MVKSSPAAENARISAAALHIAATGGWDKVTIEAVAKGAKVNPTELKKRFAAPHDLAALIAAEIDREAFAAVAKLSGTPHDILFDLLMARFDILHKNRAAILSMAAAARRDRSLSRALACATLDGIYHLIDKAQLTAPMRPLLAAGIGAIYGYAFCVWRKDASRDMASTMAAVDRALRYADKAMAFFIPRS